MPKTDRSDPAVQRLAIDEGINWLPAVEVRGEGGAPAKFGANASPFLTYGR